MSKNKYCGNCKHFNNEKMWRVGIVITPPFNGWTEITPDNVDEIRKNQGKIVIMNPREWSVPEMSYGISKETLVLYSVWGGYYYYVLPELKIE